VTFQPPSLNFRRSPGTAAPARRQRAGRACHRLRHGSNTFCAGGGDDEDSSVFAQEVSRFPMVSAIFVETIGDFPSGNEDLIWFNYRRNGDQQRCNGMQDITCITNNILNDGGLINQSKAGIWTSKNNDYIVLVKLSNQTLVIDQWNEGSFLAQL